MLRRLRPFFIERQALSTGQPAMWKTAFLTAFHLTASFYRNLVVTLPLQPTVLKMVLPVLLLGITSNGFSDPPAQSFIVSVGTQLSKTCDNVGCNAGISSIVPKVRTIVNELGGPDQYEGFVEVTFGFTYYEIWGYDWYEEPVGSGCYLVVAYPYNQAGGCTGVTGATIMREHGTDGRYVTSGEAMDAASIKAAELFCGGVISIEAAYGVDAVNELMSLNGLSGLPVGLPVYPCSEGVTPSVTGTLDMGQQPGTGCNSECGGSPFLEILENTLQVCCSCVEPPEGCPSPKVWNQETCACECPETECPPGETLNPETCDCETSGTGPNDPDGDGPFGPPPPPPPPPGGDGGDGPGPDDPDPGDPDPDGPNPEDPDPPQPPKPCAPPPTGCEDGQIWNPITCRCEDDPNGDDGDRCINCPDPDDPDPPPPPPCPPDNPDCYDPGTRGCDCPILDPLGSPMFQGGYTVEFYMPWAIWQDETDTWHYHQAVISVVLPSDQDMNQIGFHRQGHYLNSAMVDWDELARWYSLSDGALAWPNIEAQTSVVNPAPTTQSATPGTSEPKEALRTRRVGPKFLGGGVLSFDFSSVTAANNLRTALDNSGNVTKSYTTGNLAEYLLNALSQETMQADQRPFVYPNECGFVPYPIKGTTGGTLFGGGVKGKVGVGAKSQPMSAQAASGQMAQMVSGVIDYVMANGGSATGLTRLHTAINAFTSKWIQGYNNANAAGTDNFWIVTIPVIMSSVQIDLRKGLPGAPQFTLVPQQQLQWVKWISGVMIYLWGFQRIFSFWRRNAPDVGKFWETGLRMTNTRATSK